MWPLPASGISFQLGRAARQPSAQRPGQSAVNLASPGEDYLLVAQHFKSLPFSEWTEVLGSERLRGTLLDRLTHHAHILETNLDS